MLSLSTILLYLLEGVAITIAIHLISRKRLGVAEIITLSLTIAVTFMILDLFAPEVGSSARQGAGFGLGVKQIGGQSNPSMYYGSKSCPSGKCGVPNKVVEGMDDPVAIEYYQRWNPPYQKNNLPPALNTKEIYTGVSSQFPQPNDIPNYNTNQFPQPNDIPNYNTSQYEQSIPPINQIKQRVQVTQNPEGLVTINNGSNYQPIQVSELNQKGDVITSPIARQLRNNVFDTTVRSVTEIDRPGAYYKSDTIPRAEPVIETAPVLYNPLKPTYGYRYELPAGWDKLQQPELYKALNAFKKPSHDGISCSAKGYKPQLQAAEYQKKNV